MRSSTGIGSRCRPRASTRASGRHIRAAIGDTPPPPSPQAEREPFPPACGGSKGGAFRIGAKKLLFAPFSFKTLDSGQGIYYNSADRLPPVSLHSLSLCCLRTLARRHALCLQGESHANTKYDPC